ncbi:hypothetical protein RHSIM_Rhsim10G0106800 [Rhododendron simsii]|uniref:Exostosin GT47 domain-containing protein n=1 Tax=Rhododendron simsii TaxID=118357 RepID=A0A834LCG1_RHOSS|nr:hypothetical protein RHSIM_Rhsim10G0106800 [Rhododendron simsii]
MLLPISGNPSTELEGHKNHKSRVKSSPFDLTPIRNTLVLLVILLHVFLVLNLTRTHNLALSSLNVSSKTYGSLPYEACHSRWIYVYDLPPTFNYELVNSSNINLNDGFGREAKEFTGIVPESILPAWYWTDLLSGEVAYHRRMLNYKCRTMEPESATAFYIPFYAGLALTKSLGGNNTWRERDWHSEMLIKWVQQQKWWNRSNGSDHFIMLGRVSWDFRRLREVDGDWGSSFINMPAMQNVIRLSVQGHMWDKLEISVPYPSMFHPRSNFDVIEWQRFVRSRRRNHLFAFVGEAREPIQNDFQGILQKQCLSESTVCHHVDCGPKNYIDGKTTDVIAAFLDSDFCLQPRGEEGFTGRFVFDCMLAGSIPVFFSRETAYFQYELFMPVEPESYSVFINHDDVRNRTEYVKKVLEGYGRMEVETMRNKVIEYLPRFVYTRPSQGLEKIKDAFDIAIEAMLSKYKAHIEKGRIGNLNEI